jgi:hypothetical protein
VLSKLISLLTRIPAVKWAFNRLRPLPHGGSIDLTPSTASEQSAVPAIAEAAPTVDTICAKPDHRDADVELTAARIEDNAATPVVEESPSAELADISASDGSSLEILAEVEPAAAEEIPVPAIEVANAPVKRLDVVSHASPAELPADAEPEVVEEAPVSSIEIEAVDAAEPDISNTSPELPDDVEPVVAEPVFIAAAEIETVPVEATEFVVDETAAVASVEIEPVAVDETPVIVGDTEVPAPVIAEAGIDNEPAPSVAAEIEPLVASDPAPVAAPLVEDVTDDAPVVAAHIEPAPEAPAPKSAAVSKARAKLAEPADRAALIRQRWAETGIRMWNPRLHGAGEATLNIQGRIGLLPPEAGETMPRYDKLEFRMLGGQIVCEGVIVEAPVHAGQRSFTRLAEPRSPDRSREPVRERRAALA